MGKICTPDHEEMLCACLPQKSQRLRFPSSASRPNTFPLGVLNLAISLTGPEWLMRIVMAYHQCEC